MRPDTLKIETRITDAGVTLATGQHIWRLAGDLLRKYGIKVTHERFKRDLAGHRGLELAGDRVRITPDVFEEHYPSPETQHAQNQGKSAAGESGPDERPNAPRIYSGAYSMDVVDWRTGELRPTTSQDLIESVRVVEAFGNTGPYCCVPQEVPPKLRDVLTFKLCFEHGRKIRARHYSSPEQCRFIEKMYDVMGEELDIFLGVVSPLNMSNTDLDNIYQTIEAGRRYRICIIGYGVPGIASPAKLAATAALVMAENYGTAILLSLVFPENKINAGVDTGGPPDFRHCNLAFGASHTFLYNYMGAVIHRVINGLDPTDEPITPDAALMTGACLPDAQAAAEKSAIAMQCAMLGATTFSCAGSLCVDDVWSLEQFVIDREIATHAFNAVSCLDPSALLADLSGFSEEIEAIMKGVDFLSLPSTLDVMHTFYKPSLIFEHMKLHAWEGAGHNTIRQKARNKIEQKLAESHFELDVEKRRELNRIYALAEKALA